WTKRLFFSARSASLAHAWAMSSSSNFVRVSLVSLAKRTQVSAHWRYRYGRTSSPAEARTRKVSCCDAAKWGRYDGILVANASVSFEMKRPPWYRAAFSNPTLGYAAQIPASWHRRSDAA